MARASKKKITPSQPEDTPRSIRPELVIMPDTSTPASRTASKRLVRMHRVLNCIRGQGPLSRAEISKVIGFNLPTVSSLVDQLVKDHLVIESEARESPMGRRPIPVSLNPAAASVIGVDVGKRNTVAIVANLSGEILYQVKNHTPKLTNASEYVRWISKIIDGLRDHQTRQHLPPLAGIGVAIPGLVPSNIGNAALEASGMIAAELKKEIGVSVFVENDARAMALGELWFGAGRGSHCFINLNIGEGLGMGVVVDGNLLRGAHGFAGELGQVAFGDPKVEWPTGINRCLENIASGGGIARMAAEAGLKVTDANDVTTLAREGDATSKRIIRRFARSLAMGIACAINLYNPDRIVLSGRVMKSADLFLHEITDTLPEYTLRPALDRVEILVSDMIDTAGPLGAAALVYHHIFTCSHISLEEIL